jgi:hypothetical protein
MPPLGVYAGPGEVGDAEAVDQELGGRVAYALDFLSKVSWASLLDVTWLAAAWAHSPFQIVLAVPMLPPSGATLEQGAAGAFDGVFHELAQRLVAGGLGGADLVVGWQPDDEGNSWFVRGAATARAYVAYWDRIRNVMSAVPGAHFLFEWDAGDAGSSLVSPAAMYPGDADVDIVATDAFDTAPRGTPAAAQWPHVLHEQYGPAWMASFALAHHKPLAIAMWGEIPAASGGAGDDGAFVTGLLRWAADAKVQMCVMWDDGSWAMTGGGFPSASTALVGALSAHGTGAPSGASTSSGGVS